MSIKVSTISGGGNFISNMIPNLSLPISKRKGVYFPRQAFPKRKACQSEQKNF
jgi:hypothetical protein